MTTLGVSVYPDIRPLGEIAAYLRLSARHGYTRVFTSVFQLERPAEKVLGGFRTLIEMTHTCGMQVSLDVNAARRYVGAGEAVVFVPVRG